MAGMPVSSFVSYPSLNGIHHPRAGQRIELNNSLNGDTVSEVVNKMTPVTELDDETSRNPLTTCPIAGTFQIRQSGVVPSGLNPVGRTFWSILKRHKQVLIGSKISFLLPAVVISLPAEILNWGQVSIFIFSLLGIAPLAERLGFVTEQLALYTGSTVGGLLNATFGNATEMIISIFALQNGMIRVVQLSLLGSILSNMLLVLGCAFFCGGLVHCQNDQKFNQEAAVVNSGLLLMAVLGLLFPAVLHATHTERTGSSELFLSRFSSGIMLVAYGSYLYFQLKSHRQLYDTLNMDEDGGQLEGGELEEVGQDNEDSLSLYEAIAWLFVLTVLISVLSENLVNAIEGAAESWKIPVAFISVIILPIVGNAAEHASAIMFAVKDKLDLSLGVAIGSSTQISMFVIPFCVVIGWIMGKPMDLNFQLFETATLFITVLVVAFMLQEGKSNYFKGLMLVLCYLIVGAGFFVHVDRHEQGNYVLTNDIHIA
eukprot:c27541_g1_i1 orf=352-1803(-)